MLAVQGLCAKYGVFGREINLGFFHKKPFDLYFG